MTFDELYPNFEVNKHIVLVRAVTSTRIVKGTLSAPCFHDEKPTVWFDLRLQVPVCSEECDKKAWDSYIDFLR